jgi:hypothetical protein
VAEHPEPVERDRRIGELLLDLDNLRRRPSQHSTRQVSDLADRARVAIYDLLTDLRGWERDRDA